jgi:hypothetical protein
MRRLCLGLFSKAGGWLPITRKWQAILSRRKVTLTSDQQILSMSLAWDRPGGSFFTYIDTLSGDSHYLLELGTIHFTVNKQGRVVDILISRTLPLLKYQLVTLLAYTSHSFTDILSYLVSPDMQANHIPKHTRNTGSFVTSHDN